MQGKDAMEDAGVSEGIRHEPTLENPTLGIEITAVAEGTNAAVQKTFDTIYRESTGYPSSEANDRDNFSF